VWATFLLRELDDADYVPTIVAARRLDTNEPVQAVAVLVDTRSPSYFPHPPAALAAIIRRAVGTCGTNVEYAARCLSADRAIHGHLPNHLSELEKSLGVDPLSSSDKSVCREISRKGKKCSGFCFAS
jgi:cation transport regulator ChaC